MTFQSFLAGGINPDNVADAVRLVQPHGIDLCSGVEVRRGERDPKKVESLIRRFRRAAAKITHVPTPVSRNFTGELLPEGQLCLLQFEAFAGGSPRNRRPTCQVWESRAGESLPLGKELLCYLLYPALARYQRLVPERPHRHVAGNRNARVEGRKNHQVEWAPDGDKRYTR